MVTVIIIKLNYILWILYYIVLACRVFFLKKINYLHCIHIIIWIFIFALVDSWKWNCFCYEILRNEIHLFVISIILNTHLQISIHECSSVIFKIRKLVSQWKTCFHCGVANNLVLRWTIFMLERGRGMWEGNVFNG